MRKVYVDVTTRLIIQMDEGASVKDVLSEAEYDFKIDRDDIDIVDAEIISWKVTDSK